MPERLSGVLKHQEAFEAWNQMKLDWKIFLVTWMTNGYNATQAYMVMKPGASYETSRVEGAKLLAKPSFMQIRRYVELDVRDVLQRITEVEFELLEDNDPVIRLQAARQLRQHSEKFLKAVATGEEPGKEGKNYIQNNFFLDSDKFEAIKGIVNG